jgi:hypothetical protein
MKTKQQKPIKKEKNNMAQLGGNYIPDPNETEDSFDIVPAGDYIAIISASDYVANQKGTGMILKLTYEIIDGEFKGRKIFENLNLENENAVAVQIAKKTLNSICLACGVNAIQDSSQLHSIPMLLDVGIKPAKGDYDAQNKIKKHLPVNGSAPQAPAQNGFQKPAGQGSEAPKKAQPWQKA